MTVKSGVSPILNHVYPELPKDLWFGHQGPPQSQKKWIIIPNMARHIGTEEAYCAQALTGSRYESLVFPLGL